MNPVSAIPLPIANSQSPVTPMPPLQGQSPFHTAAHAQPFVVSSSATNSLTIRLSPFLFDHSTLLSHQPTPIARSLARSLPFLSFPFFFSSFVYSTPVLLVLSPRLHNGHGAHRSSETLYQLGQEAESEDEAHQGPKQSLPPVRPCQFPTWAPTVIDSSTRIAFHRLSPVDRREHTRSRAGHTFCRGAEQAVHAVHERGQAIIG